jgi:glutamine synthetase
VFANPEELLRYLSDEDVKFVDVRFCDLLGVMQHLTIPAETVNESLFTDGVPFDGSSIRGFQAIHEST